MLHSIQPNRCGPFREPMTRAVEACVHCGFCLAACPTYRELGQEMDTPRGRIVLIKQALEGELPWTTVQPHIDRCLGCLACEPACPSGVPYRDLISPFRALGKPHFRPSATQRLRRFLAAQTVPYPDRFRFAATLARVAKRIPWLSPRALQPMLDLLPDTLPPRRRWPDVVPPCGERRARVALLLSCAQQTLAPDIDAATISVLALNGVETVMPRGQVCCGALAWHTGDLEASRRFAARNLAAFPEDVDAIVTNAAGCGSAMHEYGLILHGTELEPQGEAFARRVMDVSVFLKRIGLREELQALNRPVRIAYHDACHLANAQNVRDEPRALLRMIPGVELCELPEAHSCCGSAGTYNLDQPEIAASLGQRKAKAIAESGAEMVATGNIGCLVQLQSHLKTLGVATPVRHTMQVLRDGYRGKITSL